MGLEAHPGGKDRRALRLREGLEELDRADPLAGCCGGRLSSSLLREEWPATGPARRSRGGRQDGPNFAKDGIVHRTHLLSGEGRGPPGGGTSDPVLISGCATRSSGIPVAGAQFRTPKPGLDTGVAPIAGVQRCDRLPSPVYPRACGGQMGPRLARGRPPRPLAVGHTDGHHPGQPHETENSVSPLERGRGFALSSRTATNGGPFSLRRKLQNPGRPQLVAPEHGQGARGQKEWPRCPGPGGRRPRLEVARRSPGGGPHRPRPSRAPSTIDHQGHERANARGAGTELLP